MSNRREGMKDSPHADRVATIATIARSAAHGDSSAEAKRFVETYYAQVAPEDLTDDPRTLAAAALDHLEFGRRRRRGKAKIRAFNPTLERNGWTSRHTIVQMVNDDMPFLVDSSTMTLDALGHGIHLTIHPRFSVSRDGRGALRSIGPRRPHVDEGLAESYIRIEISRQTDPEILKRIETELALTLADVRASVEDWPAMLERLRDASRELAESRGPVPDLRDEAVAFLDWLADDHFTLLGYREYRLRRGPQTDTLHALPETGLGILRETEHVPEATRLTAAARAVARSADPLVITKTNARSRVHRPAPLDYVSVKVFDAQGTPRAERRFLGLFTSPAYNERPTNIPLLRLKVQRLLEQAGVDARSHRGKTLQHVLDTFPRDDLFEASLDELARITTGILALQERRRVRLFARRDPFGRFYSCLVYLPRDQYNRRARETVQDILRRGLGGTETEAQVRMSESTLARLAVVVRTPAPPREDPDFEALEREIGDAVRTWQDRLREALLDAMPEERALPLLTRFADRFSASYQEDIPAARAAGDIHRIARVADGETRLELRLTQRDDPQRLEFTTFSADRHIPLHVALRILENMGLTVIGERDYTVKLDDGGVWIQVFDVATSSGLPADAETIAPRFEECFARVLAGDADDDEYNAFVVSAGLGWRDAALLRAYGKYLAQTALPFSQPYVQEVLARYPAFCAALVGLFHATFDPDAGGEGHGDSGGERHGDSNGEGHRDSDGNAHGNRQRERAGHERALRDAIARTSTLDEDRILRAFAGAVEGTLRTNFFQTVDGADFKPYVSFKFDPSKLTELPKPRPMFEIFVYSQRVEGVHLRAGRIARGGIRWSDRREDFRSEVLGLMKAQQVKNAVIVPNGAKGGFVCKRLPRGDRDAVRAEVVHCYKTFIRGLLDVTDNIVDERIERPARVVALDGDDPYLVVAADKGTAAFSDIANALSAEHGFWLGDAFASGGSAGYDHKKMGITARGAWESVKRHFRELDHDTQTQPFTVVGIGDMSGDVFGNGMLLSEQIRLIAAFDHRHIFVDPEPDPAESYEERKRLFELSGSTWDDYDRSRLSRGGGVFSRQAKSITLSRQACAALGISTPTLTPPELIRAVLKAPVDLLWNGGIGTYVKASDEPHASAGDPTNDSVRIDAAELRCRVVGEGGNLGFTQRARIEYALRGGRINTDFIDNSGGVESSDREVNIKILLNRVMASGTLPKARRDRLLSDMENDVVSGVLATTYGQTQALSTMSASAAERIGEDRRLIRMLEDEADLDRTIEFLPGEDELDERQKAGIGLTRPEHAVVLAYAKIHLTEQLVDSEIPDDPYFALEVERYFPPRLARRFKDRIAEHPLKREIVSMLLSSSMINRMGPFFALRARDEVGANAAQIARAYSVVREIFDVRSLWRDIEALDGQAPAAVQYETMLRIGRMVRRAVYWLLQRHPELVDIEPAIARFRPGVKRIADALPKLAVGMPGRRFGDDVDGLERAGLPNATARRVSMLSLATQILEVVQLADERGIEARLLARLHFELASKLGLDWIRSEIEALRATDRWHALARAHLRERLAREHRAVLIQVIEAGGEQGLADWLEAAGPRVERISGVLDEMRAAGRPDFAALSVALREVERLGASAPGMGSEP